MKTPVADIAAMLTKMAQAPNSSMGTPAARQPATMTELNQMTAAQAADRPGFGFDAMGGASPFKMPTSTGLPASPTITAPAPPPSMSGGGMGVNASTIPQAGSPAMLSAPAAVPQSSMNWTNTLGNFSGATATPDGTKFWQKGTAQPTAQSFDMGAGGTFNGMSMPAGSKALIGQYGIGKAVPTASLTPAQASAPHVFENGKAWTPAKGQEDAFQFAGRMAGNAPNAFPNLAQGAAGQLAAAAGGAMAGPVSAAMASAGAAAGNAAKVPATPQPAPQVAQAPAKPMGNNMVPDAMGKTQWTPGATPPPGMVNTPQSEAYRFSPQTGQRIRIADAPQFINPTAPKFTPGTYDNPEWRQAPKPNVPGVQQGAGASSFSHPIKI